MSFGELMKYMVQYTVACIQQEAPHSMSLDEIRAQEALPILGASVLPATSRLHLYREQSKNLFNDPQPFPINILNLKRLQDLSLKGFPLEGEMPDVFWTELSCLQEIILQECTLAGGIPTENLVARQMLRIIDFSNNQLSGGVPTELGSLKFLQTLNLAHNKLAGLIPHDLGQLKYLMSLDLSHNQLVGQIPDALGHLQMLFTLKLNNNLLTGPIPTTFSRTKKKGMKAIEELDLSDNRLEGILPDGLGTLKHLRILKLAHNRLGGEIPQSFGNLKNLKELNLSHNYLEGSIPQTFINLKKAHQMDLSYNGLSGEVSQEVLEKIGCSADLFRQGIKLDLQSNRLTGSMDCSQFEIWNYLPIFCGFTVDMTPVILEDVSTPYVFRMGVCQFFKTNEETGQLDIQVNPRQFLSVIHLQQTMPVTFMVTQTKDGIREKIVRLNCHPHLNEQGMRCDMNISSTAEWSENVIQNLRVFKEELEALLNPLPNKSAKVEVLEDENGAA